MLPQVLFLGGMFGDGCAAATDPAAICPPTAPAPTRNNNTIHAVVRLFTVNLSLGASRGLQVSR